MHQHVVYRIVFQHIMRGQGRDRSTHDILYLLSMIIATSFLGLLPTNSIHYTCIQNYYISMSVIADKMSNVFIPFVKNARYITSSAVHCTQLPIRRCFLLFIFSNHRITSAPIPQYDLLSTTYLHTYIYNSFQCCCNKHCFIIVHACDRNCAQRCNFYIHIHIIKQTPGAPTCCLSHPNRDPHIISIISLSDFKHFF